MKTRSLGGQRWGKEWLTVFVRHLKSEELQQYWFQIKPEWDMFKFLLVFDSSVTSYIWLNIAKKQFLLSEIELQLHIPRKVAMWIKWYNMSNAFKQHLPACKYQRWTSNTKYLQCLQQLLKKAQFLKFYRNKYVLVSKKMYEFNYYTVYLYFPA